MVLTQQASLYEHLFAITTIMKQRVVERFSGDTIDERWDLHNLSGTGSGAMVDAINEGFQVLSDTVSGRATAFGFNNIRQYDPVNCIVIFVARRVSTINSVADIGFTNDEPDGSSTHKAEVRLDQNNSVYALLTGDGTQTSQNGTVSTDTVFHSFKLELGSADIKMTIDGILDVTKTTNRPTLKLQPWFRASNRVTGAAELHIRYLEAYNT